MTTGKLDDTAYSELSVDETLSPDLVLKSREKATELQFIWSLAAMVLMGFIVVILMGCAAYWFRVEKDLRSKILPCNAVQYSDSQVVSYITNTEKSHERLWKFIDRVVLGALMSLLTLIVGYVFGVKTQSESSNST